MTQSSQVNPYAPSRLSGARPLEPADSLPRAPTAKVILATFCGVTISGGVFGAIAAMLVGLLGSGVPELVALIPFGMMFGAVVAGLVSIPVVFVADCLCLVVGSTSQGWRLGQIRWFGGVCGFMSGLLSFAIVIGLGPASLVFGILPAIFGAIGTILVSRLIARPGVIAPRSGDDPDFISPTEPGTLADQSQQHVP